MSIATRCGGSTDAPLSPGLLLVGLLICLGVLGGCAGSRIATSEPSADIVTASDESPARKRARIRLELALGYFEQGKTNIALDELKQALAVDPDFAQAHSLRGLIYMRLSDFGIAQESFQRALLLSPKDANVLHNLGWLKCQQAQYPQAQGFFVQALADPLYPGRAKTLMAQGLCHISAGQLAQAEASLIKAYEYDAANPVTGYNLALVLFAQQADKRAQFYIRRLNNSELANAETLWLGIKVERRLGDQDAVQQLAAQLEKRFSESPQAAAFRRGAFHD